MVLDSGRIWPTTSSFALLQFEPIILSLVVLHCFFHKLPGPIRTEATERGECLAFDRVIGDKEMLDLVDTLSADLIKRVNLTVTPRGSRNADQAIVACRFVSLGLFRLDDTD